MRKLLVLIPFLLLVGCAEDLAVKPVWPKVPEDLKIACPDLQKLDPATTKLSDVLQVVSANYAEYHDCRIKAEMWIEWYETQQKIYNDIK